MFFLKIGAEDWNDCLSVHRTCWYKWCILILVAYVAYVVVYPVDGTIPYRSLAKAMQSSLDQEVGGPSPLGYLDLEATFPRAASWSGIPTYIRRA